MKSRRDWTGREYKLSTASHDLSVVDYVHWIWNLGCVQQYNSSGKCICCKHVKLDTLGKAAV